MILIITQIVSFNDTILNCSTDRLQSKKEGSMEEIIVNNSEITEEALNELLSAEEESPRVNKMVRKKLSTLEYNELLNYLFRLYTKQLNDNSVRVVEFLSSSSGYEISFKRINIDYCKDLFGYLFLDLLYMIQISYNGKSYFITLQVMFENMDHRLGTRSNYIALADIHDGSLDCSDFVKELKEKSLRNSFFNNKIITIKKSPAFDQDLIDCLKVTDIKKADLNDIYIPPLKREQFERFINAIENWDNDNLPLKYLLNGPPGTGKSQLINSIIDKTKGEITVFIMNCVGRGDGRDITFSEVFEFCSSFRKCLLVIDDLDLYFSDRERNYKKKELQYFLLVMDGYFQNNLFVLASSNDKKMVDIAASRPGRFDLILDIEEINSSNYLSLISRETDDEQIIGFFTSELLSSFAMKKVTGAYIVSFIKQLKSVKKNKGNISAKDFEDYLNLTYNGFYKSNGENLTAVGF